MKFIRIKASNMIWIRQNRIGIVIWGGGGAGGRVNKFKTWLFNRDELIFLE